MHLCVVSACVCVCVCDCVCVVCMCVQVSATVSDTGGVTDSVADDHILLSVYVDDGQLHEQPVSVKVHTDRQIHRHTDRHRDTACQRQGTHRQIGTQTHGHSLSASRYTQTDRQADRPKN